jgi:hypothetical protein
MVRAAVLHERLARDSIDLGLDDRHRAPRTAGDNRVISAQPDPEAVARPGLILELEIVIRDFLYADAVLQVVARAPRRSRARRLREPSVPRGDGHSTV